MSHSAILDRVRRRVGDKRVLALIKAFLKAGILSSGGQVIPEGAGPVKPFRKDPRELLFPVLRRCLGAPG